MSRSIQNRDNIKGVFTTLILEGFRRKDFGGLIYILIFKKNEKSNDIICSCIIFFIQILYVYVSGCSLNFFF